MKNKDWLDRVTAWCVDAAELLSSSLPPQLAEIRRGIIAKHSGKASIVSVAEDLAEGLTDLPIEQREEAQRQLEMRHGFGPRLFIEGKAKKVLSIVIRGSIKTINDYELISDFASETSVPDPLATALERLLVAYDAK